MDKNIEIDFVMPWVDGGDENWRKEKNRYQPSGDADGKEERFRDWQNLQYWFRGVEKYAPWVRQDPFYHLGTSAGVDGYRASEASYSQT